MKTAKIAHTLSQLTSHLSSPSEEQDKQLDAIRRILGYNLRSKRQDIPSTTPPTPEISVSPSKEKIKDFGKYVVNKLQSEDKFLVHRVGTKDVVPVVGIQSGDLRLPINPIEALDEVRWNQKRGEQLGPFFSDEGRSIWFNLYYYEDKLTVRAQNGSVPHFLFSKARKSIWFDLIKANQRVQLKAGHVWILGKLLAKDAGVNEYIGLNIQEGTFSLSNKKKWTGQYLDFDGAFSGTMTVKLVQPDKNTASFEGCSAAQSVDFKYPDEITFEWNAGKLTSITAGNGEFTGYGNTLVFTDIKTPAVYESGLNHIFIPCQHQPTTWTAEFSQSRIFSATGTASIKKSYWALPIVKVGNPETLGEPDSSGGWGLRLSSDLTATWICSDALQPVAILNDPLLLLYPKSLFVYSDNTTVDPVSADVIRQEFSCWQISAENAARIPLSLSYQDKFLLSYYCHATEGETLLAGCSARIQPDRPIFAEGSHVLMSDLKGWVVFQSKGAEIKINMLLGNSGALQMQPKPLALENVLMFISQPAGLVLEGTLSAINKNSIETGLLTLLHGLLRWKFILPDPYVSNHRTGWNMRGRERVGTFKSVVYARISWEQPAKPIVTFKGELVLSEGTGIKSPVKPVINGLPVRLDERLVREIRDRTINEKQRKNKNTADEVFDALEERMSGWKLLDVSTNMDLIGVSVSPLLFGSRDTTYLSSGTSIGAHVLTIEKLAVNTPLTMVHVFTVPQVQWEPVRTLPEDQNIAALGWYPENLASASDGGPSRLIGISQDLSPIIPDVVVNQIRESFMRGQQAVALTTLSFGLKTSVSLRPQNSSKRNADSLSIVRPEFPQKKLKGGIQINMMAESGNPKYESRSPGFEGFMTQTLNGYELFTGTELGLSVLGATFQPDASIETQFNKEFAPGGSNPYVPVTRFDLSGYGASNFSEWDNPGAMASIGKVQFKILVGRTAFEVVKFVSKIYPWAPTVTRSVTIERRSGGGVIRKDSGWQATQSGIFDFRVTGIPTNPFEFRPGIFRGCFDIKNIRPASNDIIEFTDPDNGNNIALAPVYFDTKVQFDGQVDETVFSRGVLGFIQLEPKPDASVEPWLPRLLSNGAFRKLINDQGAIGGPMDTMLSIGNSGLLFRATRFEVDVTDNAGKPNFIAIIRGQPALPNNGSWSVVRMAAPGNNTDPQEATTADVARGTPVFIENTWLPPSGNTMNVSGPAGAYRFADPGDLFAPQPRYDYGFMQNTGSQAFLFRRPKIEPTISNEISSVLKPAFADLFAMSTSKGVFPPVPNAIEFPSANYKLLIQPGTNKLRLSSQVNLTNMRPPLLVEKQGTGQMTVMYDQSVLKFNLNFDDWNVEFDNLFFWTDMAGISNFFGNRFDLKAGTKQRSRLVNVKSLLKKEIRDALEFIPGMSQDQDVHDIDLGMTNSKKETTFFWGLECSIEIDLHTGSVEAKCKSLSGAKSEEELEEEEEARKKKHKSIEIALKAAAAKGEVPGDEVPPQWLSFAKLGIEFQAKIPIGGIWFIVLGLEAEIVWIIKPHPSESLEIAAYVGIGIGGSIGPFKAEAFLAVGLVFIYENDTAKFGGLVMLKAEVDLFIVAVEISGELKGVYYKGDDPETPAVESDVSLIDASGEVAINVSIFLLINIHASYEYEETIKP